MSFFKRAIISIMRRPGKTVILLVLVFILGNVIAGSFSIEQSVKNTEAAVLKGVVPVATLQENYMKINEELDRLLVERGHGEPNWEDPDFDYQAYYDIRDELYREIQGDSVLNVEKIEELGALPSVDFYDYSIMASLNSEVLRKYYPDNEDSGSSGMGVRMGMSAPEEGERDWFTMRGSQTGDFLDLKMGLIELVDGRTFDDDEAARGDNVVLISEQFAAQNNLQVGSTFILNHFIEVWPDAGVARGGGIVVERVEGTFADDFNDFPGPELAETLDFEFTVLGIYEPNIQPTSNDNPWEDTSYLETERRNMIYMPNSAIKEIQKFIFEEESENNPEGWLAQSGEPQEYITPMFAFRDEAGLNEFADNVEAMFGGYQWVIDNELDFDNIVAPLRNMSGLANIILYVGVGASLIILSLLITLFLRDRRTEIGIYLALGERKGRVVGQILAEVMTVAILGITLSLFSGNLISAALSNSMIDNQVMELQQKQNSRRNAPPDWGSDNQLKAMGYGTEVTLEDMAENYKVVLDGNIIIIFYVGGIITILLSTLIPILYILRLNPRKILM
ncbi:MAG: ABC transporter permease [Oscillospiraceae bacterium]|nr:ABC transporter permease [Oscillospiraceae bacterium]